VEGSAKLIKKFWQNFEWNSNSTRMQELPSTELRWNGIHQICRVPNDVQMLRLDSGVTNKQTNTLTTTTINDTHPLSHHCHRHIIIAINLWPLLPTSILLNQPTTNDVATHFSHLLTTDY
jgi:hypothetical protein